MNPEKQTLQGVPKITLKLLLAQMTPTEKNFALRVEHLHVSMCYSRLQLNRVRL